MQQALTPEFQKLLELSAMLGGVSTIGIIAFIVKAFIDGSKRKKNGNGNPNTVTVMLLQQQSETLKSLTANLTTMVALDGQQASILASIAKGIQEVKVDTTNLPAIAKQLQDIDRCLAVVKDRLNDGH
jgi:hypothetical protein